MTDRLITTKPVYDSTNGVYYKAGTAVTPTEEMATVKTRGGRKIIPGFDVRSKGTTETRVAGDKKSAVDKAVKEATGGKGPAKRKAPAKKKAAAKPENDGADNAKVEEGGPARGGDGEDKTNPLS